MSGMGNVVLIVVGGLIVIVAIILGIPYLANIAPAASSTMITSTGDAMTDIFPYLGIMIAVAALGIFFGAKR